MNVKREFSRVRAPDEVGARQRAWAVVRSAYQEASSAASRRARWRFAVLPVLVALAGAIALSPAGATIARWVKHTLGVPLRPSLPAGPSWMERSRPTDASWPW
jgi:hypothetical protein